jgi:ATP-dependent Clp protease ATP-binding subunit ClpA
LILGVAQRINTADVPPVLKGKRVTQLDINGLIAQASGERKLRIDNEIYARA